jgi:hypothetical protein
MQTEKYGMGWQRDIPDIRDYTPKNENIEKFSGGGISYHVRSYGLQLRKRERGI